MDRFDLRLWPVFRSAFRGPLGQEESIDQVTIDSRRIHSPEAIFFALQGKQDGHLYVAEALSRGAKYAIVSQGWQKHPGIAERRLIRVENPLLALQSLAKCYRRWTGAATIAICGSYGKTMVKDLLYHLLAPAGDVTASPESFNSQIGVPLALLQIKKGDRVALIEAGMSEIGEMERLAALIEPQGAILTHLGKKHLATLGSKETMIAEIGHLLAMVPREGWMMLPRDAQLTAAFSDLPAKLYYWNDIDENLPHTYSQGTGRQLSFQVAFPNALPFHGETTSEFAYVENLLNISLKAAWLLGASRDDIAGGLEQYRPEAMKTEIWKSAMGATFISDSYSSDPQSIDQAFAFYEQAPLPHRKVFVFTGMRGHGSALEENYRRVAKGLHAKSIALLLLVGESPFEPLIEEVKKYAPHIEIAHCKNKACLFPWMIEHIQPNDVVLVKGCQKEPLESFMEAFDGGIYNNRVIINFEAIRENLALLRQKLPPNTRIMPAVKAAAYGTDDVHTAKFLALCGIDVLCLSTPDEAIALRKAGATQALFAIHAAAFEADKVAKWGLEVGVSDAMQIAALAEAAEKRQTKIKLHLHVDTGMNRFGCRAEEALQLACKIKASPQLELEGIMTHFPSAEDPSEDPFTLAQAKAFDAIIARLHSAGIDPPWKHAANSAGATRFYFPQYNMVRIGLALYGLHASESSTTSIDLRPALSLRSRIVGINHCKKGETVSYGRSYRVQREFQRNAVIPIGYFDGLHRHYSEKGVVIIRGQRAPMVGKICMDFMMVDITDIPLAAIGDSVLIFGEDEFGNYLCPRELAAQGNSIVHQLITCLGPRLQRIFSYETGP